MPPITDWQFLLSLPPKPASAAGSVWAIDVPTWITAIATVGLLVGAIITAIYAAWAFRKQAEEVAILVDQNREHQRDLEHEAAERHRELASRVWVMMVPPGDEYPARRPVSQPAEADAGGPTFQALVRNTSSTRYRSSTRNCTGTSAQNHTAPPTPKSCSTCPDTRTPHDPGPTLAAPTRPTAAPSSRFVTVWAPAGCAPRQVPSTSILPTNWTPPP